MDEEDHVQLTTRLGVSHRKRWICVTAVLCSCLVVALIVIAALGAVVGIQSQSKSASSASNTSNNDSVCLTAGCIDLSTAVRQNLNEDIDPCEDFYNFSCGGWERRNVIPPNTFQEEQSFQLNARNLVAMKKVLESGQDDGVAAVKKVIDTYQSCMNTGAIDAAGVQPLLDLINKSGGWSLLSGLNDTTWNINGASFVKERLLSGSAFFTLAVALDPVNASHYTLLLQQSGLSSPIPSSYLTPNSTFPATLKALISAIISRLAPDLNKTIIDEAAAGIVELETRLAEISVDIAPISANLPKYYNLRPLKNVSYLWPDLDWVSFMTRLFKVAKVSISPDEPVFVATPTYFGNLTKALRNTSNQALENYAKWQTIRGYIQYLSKSIVPLGESRKLLVDTAGEESAVATDSYKTCIAFAQSLLPIALGRLYAAHILPNNTKSNTTVMFKYMKGAFKERLDANDWIDDTTRQRCKEKVDAVTGFISYPDQLYNNSYLNGLYAQYKIDQSDYFGNYQRSIALQFLSNLKNLHRNVSKEEFMWSNPPTQLNAFYSAQANSLIIMEAISRPPWFDPTWPDYFKFGALGAVVGHELTHGFDNKGRNYDKDGVVRQWWTPPSIAEFEKRQKCFVDQYSKYELFGHKVDGKNSLPDNIADNGGIKISFRAYKDFVKNNPQTVNMKSLPALSKYTPEQLYFIAWGQLWCAVYTDQGFSQAALADHAPSPFRVVGTAVNSQDFADTFKCPVGSKMNPKNKCLLW